jgi:hypothetical protein
MPCPHRAVAEPVIFRHFISFMPLVSVLVSEQLCGCPSHLFSFNIQ